MTSLVHPVLIERGRKENLEAINEIYNFFVRSSFTTFDTNEWSLQQRNGWFKEFELHADLYNLFIAKINGEVVGFTYNLKYKEKPAYITSSEVTVYVKHGKAGRGIGDALYKALFSTLSDANLHRLYAVIALPNDASIHLHENFGFKEVGRLNEVGYKYGKFYSTALLEYRV